MKISLKWLNEYVDVTNFFDKPEELAEIITKAGLEVEDIINRAKNFQHIKVGLILDKGVHPNADRLSLCKVTTGDGVVHQIVCGAQNHKTNDKVVLALPGAVLPGGLQIAHSAIRGVESGGMLCSLKELGLADAPSTDAQNKDAGIVILPADAPVGKAYAEYAGFDDVIFELKVTPNRADCLSHIGLAREVACLLEKEYKVKAFALTVESGTSTKNKLSLQVKKSEYCPRYTGRWIRGVKVGPSPHWLKQRLESVGMTSINNVVDVTNFVMMEMGQPLHAFDGGLFFQKGYTQNVVVDLAAPDEKFVTLDGTELKLTGTELMIKDGEKSLCMAGIIGGKNSGVSNETTDIFLEAAIFHPLVVRRSCRKHGIDTDSAYRFCRGIDPEGVVRASERAAYLITQVAGGVVFGEPHDFYPSPLKKNQIEISVQTITDRLGYPALEAKFVQFMKRLGCQIEGDAGTYKILPPSFRFDLEIDMDLVEEYARLQGYDAIPESLPSFNSFPQFHDKGFVSMQNLRQVLRAEGYQSALNFAFESRDGQERFLGGVTNLEKLGLKNSGTESVQILNPLNEELNVLRMSLTPALFRNAVMNLHHGVKTGRLFEIGSVFSKQTGSTSVTGEVEYQESQRLGLVAWGYSDQLWNLSSQKSEVARHPLVFEVKAALERLLGGFLTKKIEWQMPEKNSALPPFVHIGQMAYIVLDGRTIGYLATLHPHVLDDHKVRVSVAQAELDLSVLLKLGIKGQGSKSISKMPLVERDLALAVSKKVAVSEVLETIRAAGGGLIKEVSVFDHYQGEKVGADTKFVGVRLLYQDSQQTLNENQITETQARILESLKTKLGVFVR